MSEVVEIKFTDKKPNLYVGGYPQYHTRAVQAQALAELAEAQANAEAKAQEAKTEKADEAVPTA